MSLRNKLHLLMKVVIEESERNPSFEAALSEAIGSSTSKQKSKAKDSNDALETDTKRGKNRRAPAAIDPLQIIKSGEDTLRSTLHELSLEQLRDIVAEYGMDPGRLVMKWTNSERVIERIVEISAVRAQKGNAFRKTPDTPTILMPTVSPQPQDEKNKIDFSSWVTAVIKRLIYLGFDSTFIQKAFDEAEKEIMSEYQKGELNSAGACFVIAFTKYDLDLQIAKARGEGKLLPEITATYEISLDQAQRHFQRGWRKKTDILETFRSGYLDNPAPKN